MLKICLSFCWIQQLEIVGVWCEIQTTSLEGANTCANLPATSSHWGHRRCQWSNHWNWIQSHDLRLRLVLLSLEFGWSYKTVLKPRDTSLHHATFKTTNWVPKPECAGEKKVAFRLWHQSHPILITCLITLAIPELAGHILGDVSPPKQHDPGESQRLSSQLR